VSTTPRLEKREPRPARTRLAEDHTISEPSYAEVRLAEVLTRRVDNRAALRQLLQQIDLDEQMRRRSVQQGDRGGNR
jgi:hypothetical protein